MRFKPGFTIAFGLVLILAGSAAFAAADQCGDADLSKLTTRIYVAPAGSDSAACGASAAAPCQSIQQGINRCSGAGCGVLVRYGRYDLTATIQLKDGVSVYGRCVFAGDVDRKYRSVLLAPAEGQPAFNAANINTPTGLDGFFVRGSDATTPGGASIAMTVSNSAGLTLRWTQLVSGKGADGAPGTHTDGGQGGNGWGPSGNTGGPGGDACDGNAQGGKGGKGADIQQVASSGCFITCKCSNNNYPNSLGQSGQDSGAVKGGRGGDRGGSGCACDDRVGSTPENGHGGWEGSPGACGTQGGVVAGNSWGGFNGVSWVPTRGGQGGSSGTVGSGGGGGGSGGYAAFLSGDGHTYDAPGRPGGGGGGGGCGGRGGSGGQQGGASIPLVLFNSSVNMDGITYKNLFIPGPGGRGGNGGQGGAGGPGGAGTQGGGGHYQQFTVWGACDGSVPGSGGQGGNGGQGGAGAGGAGGNGGPSIGIVLLDKSSPLPNEQGIYAGQPGAKGSRGSGAQNDSKQCKGADGADGVAGGTDMWWQYLPEGYVFCAQENGICGFSGTKDVAYGANGRFAYKTVTNSIPCNNNIFGDPIFGTFKACYIR